MKKINVKNVHSMVGADAVIHGNVELTGGLIVYGKILGSIQTKGSVRIASSGSVLGDITSSDVHINGKVEGNVLVEDKAILGKNSTLLGDLTYRYLHIEEGAQFKGKCEIISTLEETGN